MSDADDTPTTPFIRLPTGADGEPAPDEAPTELDRPSMRLPLGEEPITDVLEPPPTPPLEDEHTDRMWADQIEAQQTERATPAATAEPRWRGLHPASLAVNLVPRAWRTLRAAWPLLLALFIGSGSMGMRAADLVILLLFTAMSVWSTFIHWVTLRYRMRDNRLEIKSGLINRQSRTIDPARIQNMELVENLFHKAAGLVELRIETAGGTSTEGLLSALSLSEAKALRAHLADVGSLAIHDEATEVARPILEMSLTEILAYGLTRRTVGTVAVLTAVALEAMGQLDQDATQELARAMHPGIILAALLIAFAGTWVLSAGASFLRHFRFRLVRTGDSLTTTEGLTTQRRIEIPIKKVQLVRADEPLLRRLMGYGTIEIETAGLGVQEGQVRQAEGVVPMVEREALCEIIHAAAPLVQTDPWTAKLLPAHPRALWRASTAGIIQAALIAIPALFFLDVLGWVALALIPLAVVNAWFDWRWQGWLVTDHAIIARHGFLNRQTYVLARDKLQSVHMVQGPLMRLHGLGRVVVRVAGSQVAMPDVSKDDAAKLMARLAG